MRGRAGPWLVAAFLALAACGRTGSPVAPERRLPGPPTEIAGAVRDGAVALAWRNPDRRADGTRLLDLAVLRVFRADNDGRGEPRPALLVRDRIAGYTEVATIRVADPAPATVVGDRVIVEDRAGLVVGRRYTYVVVAADSRGRHGPPSDRLSATFLVPPAAPAELGADPGEGEVHLRWQPPPGLADGAPLAGTIAYEILRAPDPETPLAPLHLTTPGETAAVDRDVVNDRTYHYAVRAVRTDTDTAAYGPPTPAVAATPRDMTPPAPPTALVAIPAVDAVRLSWRASPDADVAAYVVYRADADRAFARVGSTRPPVTTFVDREVPPGAYRYVVTALDSAALANESARSNEARVRVTVP